MSTILRALILVVLSTVAVQAQQAAIKFGGLRQDTSLPVEVTSDTLAVDNVDGQATFSGNVLVVQGDMRMTAAQVRVEYAADGSGIQRLHATGGVTLVSPTDAAEATEAVYTIGSGDVVMTGNVLLTQGNASIAGDRLVVNLTSGTGTMDGRVKTVFTPGGKAP